MSETSPKNLSRSCSNPFLVSQASHLLYFAFFVLTNGDWLCLLVLVWFLAANYQAELSPWLFLMMINDLNVTNTDIWMYVDDTTLAECVEKNGTSSMQLRVDNLLQSRADRFHLNESKCKKLRISFHKVRESRESAN